MMQCLCDIKPYINAWTPESNTIFLSEPNVPKKSAMSLSCLVIGENPYENAFNVKVNKTESVSELRKAIKEELHPKFENVSPNDIKLWKKTKT